MPTETKATERPTTVDAVLKTPKETWQFVTIPDEDTTGKKHPSIWLNKIEFKAGSTYQLPVPLSDYVKDRLKAFNRSVIRLFNGRADMESLNQVSIGSTSGVTPSGDRPGFVDAAGITTL
jgi:hypothetical protein